MQKSSHIARLFSVFLMSLIMIFTVFGKTFSAIQLHQQEVKKAKTEQSHHSEKSDNASISELSVMQVSASVTIDFTQDFVFTPQTFSFLMLEKKFSRINNLSFRLPLLEILFEHFIVTNAP
jgi:cytoskeletal protein RodZ